MIADATEEREANFSAFKSEKPITSFPNNQERNLRVSPDYFYNLAPETVAASNIAQTISDHVLFSPFKFPQSDSSTNRPRPAELTFEEKFNKLARIWKRESKMQSSLARITSHPAYLEIISLGEPMIPFILRDLQKEPNHWFTALYILAGRFSPVKREDAGNISKMTQAWLQWGIDNAKLG